MTVPADPVTVGVAIGVPEPWSTELRSWRDKFGDPLAHKIPPHVTLVPPTRVESAVLPGLVEHLAGAAVGVPPFRVHLRGAGTFRPVSPVVFVPLATGIPCCETLADVVRSGPLARDLTFPYHPHVTVAHDVVEAMLDRAYDELASFEADFEVERFTLFEQGGDQVWRPQRDFPLEG